MGEDLRPRAMDERGSEPTTQQGVRHDVLSYVMTGRTGSSPRASGLSGRGSGLEASAVREIQGGDRVVYVSSLSKTVAPGLRIGWVVAPPAVHASLTAVKQSRDLHTSTIDQRAAYEYLATGALPGHLARLREAYGARLRTMLAALPSTMPPGTTWTEPEGGMFVWATLPPPHDTSASLPAVVAEGAAYVPGTAFSDGEDAHRSARLSFVTLEPHEIEEALARVGRGLRSAP